MIFEFEFDIRIWEPWRYDIPQFILLYGRLTQYDPLQIDHHFTDDIFKRFLYNASIFMFITNRLNHEFIVPTNNTSA